MATKIGKITMLSEQTAVVASLDFEVDVEDCVAVDPDGAYNVEETTAEVGERLTEAAPTSTVK